MKKNYKFQSVLVMLTLFVMSAFAQETRIVKVDGWAPPYSGDPEVYRNVLYNAIMADSTARKTNPNVIFELKRNHKYPEGSPIKNYDFHLHIRAEEGVGLLPELIPGKNSAGEYGSDYILAYNDLTLHNIAFNGFCPDGKYNNRMVEVYGKKMRYIVEGCSFDGDRGAGISVRGDSMKVYVKDVIVTNCGHRKSIGGNGRIIDLRPEALYLDTLIVVNSTVTNASDRVIRNMNTIVNYLELDHLTAANSLGENGAVQLGHVRTAKVTNCLFANVLSQGHSETRTLEQTHPEKHFAVITLDTVFDGQVIEIRNNNIFFDQEIKTVWDKYDEVEAPWPITPTIITALGNAEDDAYFEEVLSFTQTCGPVAAFVDAYYDNPNALEYPENWCVGGEGGYFPDQVDLSYSAESVSYTAGDDGFPVGDLNYFPELKAQWESGYSSIRHKKNINTGYLRNYPNPFTGTTTITYTNHAASDVSLVVYDITGRIISELVNEFQTSGTHKILFDASELPEGAYFYKLSQGSSVSVGKMIMMK
ncbi:MAG: T9SS type A sorting domain-containing protein [Bacteroidales bacterium]|nr:T9SS type A sorting domain-containing protein [Bacteroidales bacterium]